MTDRRHLCRYLLIFCAVHHFTKINKFEFFVFSESRPRQSWRWQQRQHRHRRVHVQRRMSKLDNQSRLGSSLKLKLELKLDDRLVVSFHTPNQRASVPGAGKQLVGAPAPCQPYGAVIVDGERWLFVPTELPLILFFIGIGGTWWGQHLCTRHSGDDSRWSAGKKFNLALRKLRGQFYTLFAFFWQFKHHFLAWWVGM